MRPRAPRVAAGRRGRRRVRARLAVARSDAWRDAAHHERSAPEAAHGGPAPLSWPRLQSEPLQGLDRQPWWPGARRGTNSDAGAAVPAIRVHVQHWAHRCGAGVHRITGRCVKHTVRSSPPCHCIDYVFAMTSRTTRHAVKLPLRRSCQPSLALARHFIPPPRAVGSL